MTQGRITRTRWQRVIPFTRVEVAGDSMRPLLEPGDRLVVLRTSRVQPGQIAVATDPREPTRPLIKRVVSVGSDGVVLHGDNAAESTDSRSFGALPAELLKGRAVYRYAPPDRIGRL